MRPLYIAAEGPGGGGKSTHRWLRSEILQDITGRKVFLTREPGGPPKAEKLRAKIFSAKKEGRPGIEIVEMFYAARQISLRQHVKPNLARGNNVDGDRYAASIFAYEGGGEKVPLDRILDIHLRTVGNFGPDLTVYFRVANAETVLERTRYQTNQDSFDSEGLDYQRRVIAVYDKLFEQNSNSSSLNPIFGLWILIDTDVSMNLVESQIKSKMPEAIKTVARLPGRRLTLFHKAFWLAQSAY